MSAIGNTTVNERYLSKGVPPINTGSDQEMEIFIRNKYEKSLYSDSQAKLPAAKTSYSYPSQIAALCSMGFTDVELNIRILQTCDGNLPTAIEQLVKSSNDTNFKQSSIGSGNKLRQGTADGATSRPGNIIANHPTKEFAQISSPTSRYPPNIILKLNQMGFRDNEEVENALLITDGHVEKALSLLLEWKTMRLKNDGISKAALASKAPMMDLLGGQAEYRATKQIPSGYDFGYDQQIAKELPFMQSSNYSQQTDNFLSMNPFQPVIGNQSQNTWNATNAPGKQNNIANPSSGVFGELQSVDFKSQPQPATSSNNKQKQIDTVKAMINNPMMTQSNFSNFGGNFNYPTGLPAEYSQQGPIHSETNNGQYGGNLQQLNESPLMARQPLLVQNPFLNQQQQSTSSSLRNDQFMTNISQQQGLSHASREKTQNSGLQQYTQQSSQNQNSAKNPFSMQPPASNSAFSNQSDIFSFQHASGNNAFNIQQPASNSFNNHQQSSANSFNAQLQPETNFFTNQGNFMGQSQGGSIYPNGFNANQAQFQTIGSNYLGDNSINGNDFQNSANASQDGFNQAIQAYNDRNQSLISNYSLQSNTVISIVT